MNILIAFLELALFLLVPIFMIAYGIGLFLWTNRNADKIREDVRKEIEKYQGPGLWRGIARWYASYGTQYRVEGGRTAAIGLVVMGVICLVVIISWIFF